MIYLGIIPGIFSKRLREIFKDSSNEILDETSAYWIPQGSLGKGIILEK